VNSCGHVPASENLVDMVCHCVGEGVIRINAGTVYHSDENLKITSDGLFD
jgi:hypothetical protein